MPLAHVAMEHRWDSVSGDVDPGMPHLELDGEVLATCDHHGPPVRLR